jgi:hypothetical protein
MTTWRPDELDRIGASEGLLSVTVPEENPMTIWVVHAGGELSACLRDEVPPGFGTASCAVKVEFRSPLVVSFRSAGEG